MKRFLGALLLVSFSACEPDAACRSLTIGQPMTDFRKAKFGQYTYGGRTEITSRAVPGYEFDVGPVEDHLCCYSKAAGKTFERCSEAQRECTDPAFQNVEFYSLGEPFYFSRGDDGGQFCAIAAKEGRIVAIWSRYWG